jgi:hypothetical protein
MTENTNEVNTCKNCENIFTGNFCNNCGQAANIHPINHRHIIKEISDSIIKVNNGFIFTVKQLFLYPGKTIHEYIDGKRIKYFKPVTFILVLATFYTFLEHSFNRKTFLEEILLEFKNLMFQGKFVNSNVFKILDWMISHTGYSILLSIPIFSLASFFAFYKSKNNYYKHLILNNYLFGETIVFYIFIGIISHFISNKLVLNYFDIFRDILIFTYTIYVYYQYFNQFKPINRILRLALTFFYLSIFMLFIIITISML